MRDKIEKYISDTMKSYGVSGSAIKNELANACCDEYNMQVEKGVAPYEAYEAAVANVEEIVKGMVQPGNRYAFSLGMGILALVISVGEMLASLLARNIYFYEAEMLVVCAGWIVITVLYAVVCRKSLRWYNFVVLGVLLASWLTSLFIIFPLFLFNGPPGCSQHFEFIFPCVFERRWRRDWFSPGYYETDYWFYANFIIALATFAAVLVLYVNERAKIKLRG